MNKFFMILFNVILTNLLNAGKITISTLNLTRINSTVNFFRAELDFCLENFMETLTDLRNRVTARVFVMRHLEREHGNAIGSKYRLNNS